jgi:outer membrane protein assembly factor BamB
MPNHFSFIKFLAMANLASLLSLSGFISEVGLSQEQTGNVTSIQNEWGRFRGPNGNGVQPKTKAPIPWQASDVRWKIDLPGSGNSSPVVWKDRVYIFTAYPDNASRELLAIDLKTGRTLWQKSYPSEAHPLHQRSSYASSTPVVDDSGIYIAWGVPNRVEVRALTHSGDEVWNRDLGRYVSQHGFGTSPIIVDNKLILINSQDAEELPEGVEPGVSSIVALNLKSGETIWENKRRTTRVCYGVPCVIKQDNKTLLLGAGTVEGFFAINAEDGKTEWELPAFDKRVVSSAVLSGGLLISTCGSGGGGNELIAISILGEPKEAYRIQRAAPYVPTPVVAGPWIFMWADNGIVSCAELSDGKVRWQQRIGGNVSSSPVVANDCLIGMSEDGVVTFIKAGPEFEKLGQYNLEDMIRSTPAITENEVLLRTDKFLICIGAQE